MKFIRQVRNIDEYWDEELLVTIAVPHGQAPVEDKKVAKEEGSLNVGAVDSDGVVKLGGTENNGVLEKQGVPEIAPLEKMTLSQLKGYADKRGIEIPGDISRKSDILEYLANAK